MLEFIPETATEQRAREVAALLGDGEVVNVFVREVLEVREGTDKTSEIRLDLELIGATKKGKCFAWLKAADATELRACCTSLGIEHSYWQGWLGPEHLIGRGGRAKVLIGKTLGGEWRNFIKEWLPPRVKESHRVPRLVAGMKQGDGPRLAALNGQPVKGDGA